ncbi:MAG TPA: hypothetical protein VEC19_00505 [Usitatibacter sp.]|nr:hypothetical protein [Usitatibacter sp.]
MKFVFSAEGARALRSSWTLLGLAIVVGVSIVGGSTYFLEREKRENVGSSRRVQEARSRVEAARRERDNLQESSEVFRTLVSRGLLQSEKRLDLVEFLNTLRLQHQLFGLDYEIAPQRTLQLPGGRNFPAVDVLASRVKFRVRALHEGDVLGFVDAIANSRQGFYPVDRCVMRRVEQSGTVLLQPRVEADCTLEWITLKAKRAA